MVIDLLYNFTFSHLWAKEVTAQHQGSKGSNAMNEQFIGKWEGTIETPNGPLPIIIDLKKESGTLSVPAQGLSNFPFQSVTYTGDKVKCP